MKKSLINILALMILSLHLMAAVSVDVNGTNYTIPETGEQGWGENVTMWIQGISANTIHPDGGDFNLTDELSFGSSYGLKSLYYKSDSSDPASSGEFRLANSDTITFRNNANDDDLELGLSTDTLQFNSIDLVDLSTTQSLSNKTLTSPVINTGVSGSAVLDDDSMSTVSATTLATSESIKAYVDAQTEASVTLTNKTLDAPVIDNALVITEEASSPSNPSSGFKKLYPKTNGRLYTLDSAGNELEVGSGGESGSKNYIDSDSADLEVGIGSWTTDDGAGSAAVYLTLSQETSVQLAGDGSLKLVKSANDASSEYIKLTTQAIDLTDRGKALFGSFSFDATHASYASSDFLVEIYDNTNSAVLYSGVAEDLEILKTKGRFNFVTSTESTTAEIEVRLKVNSTNASAYDLYFDEFKLGPAAQISAPIVTEWQQFTPTGTWTTNTTYTGSYRRVGDSLEMQVAVTLAGAPNATTLTVNLPPGLTIDTAKLADSGTTADNLGYAFLVDVSSAAGRTSAVLVYNNSTSFTFLIDSAGVINSTAPFTWASTDEVRFFTKAIPISGWGAGALVSENELSLQTVRVSGAGNGGNSITANVTNYTFTEVRDSHGAWNGTQFTAPKTGYYKAQGGIAYTAGVSGLFYAYVDGTLSKLVSTNGNASYNFHKFDWSGYLEKGELLSFRGPAGTLSNSTTLHWIEISSLPDYTVIGAVKEKNKIQTKTLSADVTTNTTISDLTFSNLVIGKWYDVTGKLYFQLDVIVADSAVSVSPTHDSSILDYYMVLINEASDTSTDLFSIPVSFKFKATATSLTFVSSSTSTSSKIAGDNSRGETYIQLEERNDLVETSDF